MAHEPADPNKPIGRESHGKIITVAGIPVGRHVEEKITFHAKDPITGKPGARLSKQQFDTINALTAQGISNFTVDPLGNPQFYSTQHRRLALASPTSTYKTNGGSPMAGFLSLLGGALPLVSDLLKPAIGQLSRKIYGSRAVTGYSKSEMRRLVASPGNGGPTIPDILRGVYDAAPYGSFPLGQEKLPPQGGGAFPALERSLGLGGRGQVAGPPAPWQSGYHWSQRAGKWVRNRRMNPCNPKALRRAMRRTASFAKFAKSAITFTQRVKMKKRKRR